MTEIIQIDSFTDKPFHGNPAGVCVLDEPAEESWMQDIAKEMNLSETAFLFAQDSDYNLRWFTPEVEVDLCGHATLASAHALWEEGLVPENQSIKFHTKSGELGASRNSNLIELDFPATAPEERSAPEGLESALGIKAQWIGKNVADYFVVVDSESTLRALTPDFSALARLKTRGIIVTARSADSSYDFVSRFFAPACGIDEDPVTGSAHCTLGPYWGGILGKSKLRAFQASARGGEVIVTNKGDRTILAGRAVTVLRCQLV